MSGSFHQIPGSLVQIAAGSFAAWGVNASQDIFFFDGNGFRQVPGGLAQIAAGGGSLGTPDNVWGINGEFFLRFDPNTQLFGLIPVPGAALVQIVVSKPGGSVRVWGINASTEIFRFNPNTQLFEQIPGSLVQIADGWGINASRTYLKIA